MTVLSENGTSGLVDQVGGHFDYDGPQLVRGSFTCCRKNMQVASVASTAVVQSRRASSSAK